MLYHLFLEFQELFSAFNVFRYITFRAFCAFSLAFIFVLIFQPIFIRYLMKTGVRQPIREDGPKDHDVKSGTPTMGGLVVIASVLLATLLFADLSNILVWLVLFVMMSLAALGFIDDWLKIKYQNSDGVSERTKLLVQTFIACIPAIILMKQGFSTTLVFPFFKNLIFELDVFFIIFAIIVIIGSANAVNLTDGLDGLAIGPVMTVAVTYALFAYVTGHKNLADYLNISYIAGAGELSIIMASVLAGGLGFLWYNTFPAQVFMGDIGSLSLGGVLGIVAVLVKQELVLVIAGGVFVVETLSVIIQRYYYKLTKKRVFLMAPIHHHFELKGWAEPKIIVRFWIISIVLAFIALATLKLR